jgi:DNA-binding FrmR family transcriptional regulator
MSEPKKEVCCCEENYLHEGKARTEEEVRDLIRRLNRIEGQIRGIRGMVERGVYCPEILTQVSAAQAALNSFSKEILGSHIRGCVAEDIRKGKDEAIDELLRVLQKTMR